MTCLDKLRFYAKCHLTRVKIGSGAEGQRNVPIKFGAQLKRFRFLRRLPTFCHCKLLYDDASIHSERSAGQERAKMGFFFFEDLQSGILIKKNWVWRIRDANFGLKLAWMIDYGWIRLCTFRGPADNQRLGIYVLHSDWLENANTGGSIPPYYMDKK